MQNLRSTDELIQLARASMEHAGYSAEYISALSSTWDVLKTYLPKKDILHFTPKAGSTFLQEKYNINSDYNHLKLSEVDKRRKRAIIILNNCFEHEKILVPKSYSLSKFNLEFAQEFQEFIDMRIQQDLSLQTINRDIYCLNRLSDYLYDLDIQSLEKIESAHVIGFMKKLSAAGKLASLKGIASSLRLFFRFIFAKHYVSKDLSSFVPQVKSKPYRIPSVYTQEEIQRLLDSLDRASPKGKRDYAMVLLAARLGMRSSDISELKFENLKWETDTVEFVVKKTGVVAVLPLLDEVGEAIIEYLKYGRPDSKDKHIFLRMQVPLTKISPSALHAVVSAGLRKADIPLLPGKRHGPHALRASLASAMLDKGTPLPVISEALTHANSDTTRNYLKIDVGQLRKYSLEVPPLGNVWMGGIR